MKRLYPYFGQVHPSVSSFYFLLVLVSCFLTKNPVFLLLCFFSAMLYQWVVKGLRRVAASLMLALPTAFFMMLLNPLFNQNGMTPLFYWNNRPFTLESLLYGAVIGAALINTLLWFGVANDAISQDKIIYLLGKPFPTAAFLMGTIFRVTATLRQELKSIQFAQQGLGFSIKNGPLRRRIKNGAQILLCVVGNALEHSVDTAMSMRGRGYGIQRPSRHKQYYYNRNDAFLTIILVLFAVLSGWMVGKGWLRFDFFPSLYGSLWGWQQITAYILSGLFFNLPLLYNCKEEIRWRYLNSKM